MIRKLTSEWRFDSQQGWSLKTKLYNQFWLLTH